MSDPNRTSFPLSWPEGWPRVPAYLREESRFLRSRAYHARRKSMDEARHALAGELRRMGAQDEILSTNVRLRLDGMPYSGQAQPPDTGAAVYFKFKERTVSLACDKWNRVEDNIFAIAKHIESLRGQERWGVGTIEQAFRGYMALPSVGESGGLSWWKVLGVPLNSSADQVKEAYRALVKIHHPDAGGDPELFHRLAAAWEQFESIQSTVTERAA